MKFFEDCRDLDSLKRKYRKLAMIHHPDRGGDTATMQAINAEYDAAFSRLKLAYNRTAATPTHETGASTRSEFYTANGWRGENYDSRLTTTEISKKIREYVKKAYPDCKFSVTTSYGSMCSSISVHLMSGPYPAFRDPAEKNRQLNYYYLDEDEALTDWARAVMIDVNDYVCSYNYEDCDSMIDYFDVGFYRHLEIGKWNRPYEIINKPKKISSSKRKSKPTTTPATTAPRVEIRPDFSGAEVYFSAPPSAEIRSGLKENGWRWDKNKKCWYTAETETGLQALRAITA